MPIINTENDNHTFLVQVKNKCTVYIDAFELTGRLMESSLADKAEPSIDDIDLIMREIAWTEGEDTLEDVTKYEMFAVASKAIDRMNELGK